MASKQAKAKRENEEAKAKGGREVKAKSDNGVAYVGRPSKRVDDSDGEARKLKWMFGRKVRWRSGDGKACRGGTYRSLHSSQFHCGPGLDQTYIVAPTLAVLCTLYLSSARPRAT